MCDAVCVCAGKQCCCISTHTHSGQSGQREGERATSAADAVHTRAILSYCKRLNLLAMSLVNVVRAIGSMLQQQQ